jgi:hypothetical protein
VQILLGSEEMLRIMEDNKLDKATVVIKLFEDRLF